MLRQVFLFLCLVILSHCAGAQEDSVQRRDTVRRNTPPVRRAPRPAPAVVDTAAGPDSFFLDTAGRAVADSHFIPPPLIVQRRFDTLLLTDHPFYRFRNPLRRMESVRVRTDGKEDLFYCVTGLLLLFALIRNAFGRYLQDLFRLYFRSSLKQRQAKEQLMEAYLPSLLLNILFVLSGALFLSLVVRRMGLGLNFLFWELFLYSVLGLSMVYLGKFLTLKFCGWIFRVTDATDTYIFIVFATNKVIGILLLPFIILLAFTASTLSGVALTLSLILVVALLFYRFVASYLSIRRMVKMSLFHFSLYLLAFEIVPLLLINKLLLQFLG